MIIKTIRKTICIFAALLTGSALALAQGLPTPEIQHLEPVLFGNVGLCPSGQNGSTCSLTRALPVLPREDGAWSVQVFTDGQINGDFTLNNVQVDATGAYFVVSFQPKYAGLRRGMVVFSENNVVVAKQPIYGYGIGAQLAFGFASQQSFKSGGHEIVALALDDFGNEFYSDLRAQKVYERTKDGATRLILSGRSVVALTIGAAGEIIFGDFNSRALLRTTLPPPSGPVENSPQQTFTTLIKNVRPISLAMDGESNIYAVDELSGHLLQWTPDETSTISTTHTLSGVAVTGSGNLVVEAVDGSAYQIVNGVETPVATGLLPKSRSFTTDAANLFGGTQIALEKLGDVSEALSDQVSSGITSGAAINAAGNIVYSNPYLGTLVHVNRSAPAIALSSSGAMGTLQLENIGNQPMTNVAVTLNGASFGGNCSSIQPGNSCETRIFASATPEQELSLLVRYSSNGQTFARNLPVTLESSEPSTLTGAQVTPYSGGLAINVTFTGSPFASGEMSITLGNQHCTVAPRASSASCELPASYGPLTPGAVLDWSATYEGDDLSLPAAANGTVTVQPSGSGQFCWNGCKPEGS